MAGGRPPIVFYAKKVKVPQWSPGLMAGGRPSWPSIPSLSLLPQWSPGLMAGGSALLHPFHPGAAPRRNGAPA